MQNDRLSITGLRQGNIVQLPPSELCAAAIPQFFVATRDEAGRPWCSVVCGPVGFISSPDRSSLVIDSFPIRDAGALVLRQGG